MGMSDKPAAPSPEAEKPLARLCYVDDSRTAAFVMRRMLEPAGYRVDYFQSAEPAVVALIQNDYDLLLTDLKVSSTGMDGDDLIRTLRNSGQAKLSQLPIIVITGSTDAEVLVRAYDAGANQVMTKPVDADALDGHIRRLLFEGREPGEVTPAEEPGAAVEVPVVMPLQTPATKRTEKDIPVLEAAEIPRPHRPGSVSGAPREAALSAATAGPREDRLSLIERAVASEASRASAGQGTDSELPHARAGDAGRETPPRPREAADTPSAGAEAMSAPAADVFEEYDGEVEIIIDPEQPAGRKRRNRPARHDDDEILLEISRFGHGGAHPQPTSRPRRVPAARGLLVLLLLAGAGFAGLKGWQQYFDKGLPVQTTIARSGEIFQSLVLPGHVVSQQQVEIVPAHEGRLVSVLVDEGDRVEAGQVLARLDERDLLTHLQRVQADLANGREDIELAERTLARLQRAYAQGTVARRFVEDAEIKLRAARARAGVSAEDARQAMLELEKQKITAPFSGIIRRRQAEVGQWVTPADALFLLADEERRAIEVQVDAAGGSSLSVGQMVLVTSDAFPGLEWREEVTGIGSEAEGGRSNAPLKVLVSLGDEAPALRLGQPVDAEIRTAWNPNAIKVPFEALLNRQGGTYVAVMQDGRVRMKRVITGIEDFAMAEIRQGLEAGEEVILPRGQRLQDGDRVHRPDSP